MYSRKMSRPSVQCIILTQKAEVKQAKLTLQEGLLTLDGIKQYLKKKDNPEILGTYRYKTYTLTLLGYTKGKAGTENKHELPPPLDSNLCFGDIILIASTTPSLYSSPVSFKTEEYEAFYTKVFGGFEDIDSEEEEDDEDIQDEIHDEIQDEKEKIVVEADEEGEDEEGEDEIEEEAEVAEPDVVEPEDDLPVRPAKLSKKKRAAQVVQSGASQILHISKDEHLTSDTESSAHLFPVRVQVTTQISSLLQKNAVTGIDVKELERSIYNACITEALSRHVTCHWKNTLFQHIYQTKVRHIIGNIIPSSYVQNTKLLDELKTGKYSLEVLCSLDTYSICNNRWKDFIHRRGQREKRQLEGNKAMATDQFYCGQCHKRECTYYEMQTRSADEPMTIFITCLNCGKHWRQ